MKRAGVKTKKWSQKRGPSKRPFKSVMARRYARGPSIRGEQKISSRSISADFNTTGSVELLNGLSQGSDNDNRLGRKIFMKYVEGIWKASSTLGSGVAQSCRILIVYDRQSNGAAPAITDVLTTNNSCALKDYDARDRFLILLDEFFDLPNFTGTEFKMQTGRFYRKIGMPTIFNSGNAGTVADIASGSLYLLTIGDVAAGATDGALTIKTRLHFVDN